jgi:tRNA threonylcarbamoyladenosine biosynthesis protein TsaB
MRILALDTATESCSVAIVEDQTLLAEVTEANRQTHARYLMDLIRTALLMARVELKDIEGIAVSRGPGSFTGLRIGIGTAKGLAEALGKPLVGVSSLKALALQAGVVSQLIFALIDARRGEVYYAAYHQEHGSLVDVVEESVGPPAAALEKVVAPCLFIGNGAMRYKSFFAGRLGAMPGVAWAPENIIRAAAVARLGHERLCNGDFDDVAAFAPLYLRPSDAQVHCPFKRCLEDGEKPAGGGDSRISGLKRRNRDTG